MAVVLIIFAEKATVPVADCTAIRFSSHQKCNWVFADYVSYLRSLHPTSTQTVTRSSSSSASIANASETEQAAILFYLKDCILSGEEN